VWNVSTGPEFAMSSAQVLPTWGGAAKWCDFDLDGDLDLTISGRTSSGADTTLVYLSDAEAVIGPNTAPTPPTELTATLRSDSLSADLTWSTGSDGQTAATGLTYSVRIGTQSGFSDIYSTEEHGGAGALPRQGSQGPARLFTTSSLERGTYYWSVRSVDSGFLASAWATDGQFVITKNPTADAGIPTPLSFGIHTIQPNPTRGTTNFIVGAGDSRSLRLRIFDVRSRTLLDGGNTAEANRVIWDGRDSQGGRVAAGVYFVRLEGDHRVATKKLIVLP
jgi:hypothetical protein